MKTNLDKIFKTSAVIEKSGVWLDISEETGFLVRPFNKNNPNIKSAMAVHFKPHQRQIEMGTLDPSKEAEINAKVFVNSCLIDWKGVEIDGVDTPFSKEVAIKFLVSLPELFETLMSYAQDYKNYQEIEDETLGNS